MDSVDLDLMRRDAGARYLEALRDLGLYPAALFWGHDKVERRFVLLLATEMVDFKGPLAVGGFLIKAYNAAATPKEIDPFIVRLHSPDHTLIRQFDGWKDLSNVTISAPPGADPIDPSVKVSAITLGDVEFRSEWIYCFNLPPKRKSIELSRKWKRFTHNVDRLAA